MPYATGLLAISATGHLNLHVKLSRHVKLGRTTPADPVNG